MAGGGAAAQMQGSAGSTAGRPNEACFPLSPQITADELSQRAAMKLAITLPALTSDDPYERAGQLVDAVRGSLSGGSGGFPAVWLHDFVLHRFMDDSSTGKPAPLSPEIGLDVEASMAVETKLAIAHWIGDEHATLSALLTDDTVFLDDNLAAHYGISHAFTQQWEAVPQPASERAGILTLGPFLARFPSAPRRAVQLVQSLGCSQAPPAPPVPVSVWDDPGHPSAKDIVTEQYGDTTSPTCKACHQIYVGYGIALDRYDAVGRYRSTLGGKPIDTSYSLYLGYDQDGEQVDFASPQELGNALSRARSVRSCLVRKFAESLGAREMTDPELSCVLEKFDASQGSFWSLFADLSPAYLGN